MKKNTIISVIISIAILGGTFYFISDKSVSSDTGSVTQFQNVEIKDGIQYVTVTAKGGYSPRTSAIQSNLPTKLIVKTNGTYDCSVALNIRAVGFQKILEPKGEEIIDLGTPKAGETIQGICAMGMYSFEINVS